MDKIQKTVRALIGYKIFVILAGSFIPYVGTYAFQQTDVLGITMRYWMRWTQEGTLQYPLLPAILNSGDSYGIIPMGFPLLNLLTAPGFILGLDYGRFGAFFLHSLILIGLVWWNYRIWRDKEILGFKVGITPWLFIIFGTAQFYFTKYMPDAMAFLLMCLACGYSWERLDIKRSLPLAALGLLVKPPVVFLFGLFLAKNFKFQIKNFFFWALPAVVICLLYYKMALPKITEISDVGNVFSLGLRNPITSLVEFFTEPSGIYKLFIKNFFTKYIVFLLLIDLGIRLKNKCADRHLKLWGVFLIQTIASAALIGETGFIHEYYFISTAFISCLLFKDFLENAAKPLKVLAMIVLVGFTIERSIYTLRPPLRGHFWYECREMNSYIPDDVLKLNTKKYWANPIIGVCMSKIVNSEESDWAMYHRTDDEIPEMPDFELVHKTEHFNLYKKQGQ